MTVLVESAETLISAIGPSTSQKPPMAWWVPALTATVFSMLPWLPPVRSTAEPHSAVIVSLVTVMPSTPSAWMPPMLAVRVLVIRSAVAAMSVAPDWTLRPHPALMNSLA